ncbi:MAG: hypothetical protein JXA42_16480 [Anaerolineales bacterium]|nr:hypothetical protein [Anaerolineales bacterium]
MKWSQLKKRAEDLLASSVANRIHYYTTRYRDAHDEAGESWITFDGQRLISMGTLGYEMEQAEETELLCRNQGITDFRDPKQYDAYMDLHTMAIHNVHERNVFAHWDLCSALYEYLNLSIEEALGSTNPIIRAVSLLDKRCGKRRLRSMDISGEYLLVQMLYRIRCEAEGINVPNHR